MNKVGTARVLEELLVREKAIKEQIIKTISDSSKYQEGDCMM